MTEHPIAKRRLFDHHWYQEGGVYGSRRDANRQASKLRKQGRAVRIVQRQTDRAYWQGLGAGPERYTVYIIYWKIARR